MTEGFILNKSNVACLYVGVKDLERGKRLKIKKI